MKNLFSDVMNLIKVAIEMVLTFLCLGVAIQILINDTILGWDPVGNIQDAGSAFVGVIALVVLYLLFINKK